MRRVAHRAVMLVAVLLAGCGLVREPPFDTDAACGTAGAPAATAADLQRISDTINDASNGEYKPQGKDVERFSAAVLLGEAAREAAAPFALPSELRGNLPERPDTTKVRALQNRLATACHG